MKKLLFVCLFAVAASTACFAQGGGQGRTPAAQLERLKGAVTGITADQETKITAIYTAAAKSQDSLRAAANGDMASVRDKMMPMRAATNAKIKAVLTADQQKQFDAMPQFGRGGQGGAPRN